MTNNQKVQELKRRIVKMEADIKADKEMIAKFEGENEPEPTQADREFEYEDNVSYFEDPEWERNQERS